MSEQQTGVPKIAVRFNREALRGPWVEQRRDLAETIQAGIFLERKCPMYSSSNDHSEFSFDTIPLSAANLEDDA